MSPNRISNTISTLINAYYILLMHAVFRIKRQEQASATLLDWVIILYLDAEMLSLLLLIIGEVINSFSISEKLFWLE